MRLVQAVCNLIRRTLFSTDSNAESTQGCRVEGVMPVTCSKHAQYMLITKSVVGCATCSLLTEKPHPVNASTISGTDIDGNQN